MVQRIRRRSTEPEIRVRFPVWGLAHALARRTWEARHKAYGPNPYDTEIYLWRRCMMTRRKVNSVTDSRTWPSLVGLQSGGLAVAGSNPAVLTRTRAPDRETVAWGHRNSDSVGGEKDVVVTDP